MQEGELPLVEVEPGHYVACWLYSEGRKCRGITLLKVVNVSKTLRYGVVFGFQFNALENINLELGGTPFIYAIAGESGSGKSTLAKIILGTLEPDLGEVLYKNKNMHKLSRGEKMV